ncbi:hypothetical protein LJR078_003235 [Arthrobacter sp. LjRoot78]
MNRIAAALAVARLCKGAGITKTFTPHGLGHSLDTACLDAGVPLRDVPDRRPTQRPTDHCAV